MTVFEKELRVAEYESLRNEIHQNKQYIFERPLIIIGAAAVAAAQLGANPITWFIPPILIAFLWLNVEFTVDRIRSTARIVSYICLFHESSLKQWIGWENALRAYRIWVTEHQEDRKRIFELSWTKTEQPKAMVFYPAVFWIHGIPATISLFATFGSLPLTHRPHEICAATLTAVLFIAFAIVSVLRYNPKRMTSLIEYQRDLWLAVLNPSENMPD